MKALDDGGIADDTIVVFTSDNGGERYADTWPFTGKKTELLEGGLRIPAIISWPARIKHARHKRPGDDQHGLAAHPTGRRRAGARPGLPPATG